MRSVVRNLIIVIAALVIAVWAIIPPEKKLRLGKDLRGGVSLVYSVMVRPGDSPNTVAQVIDVLKERVDPRGQSDITMVQQGRDRIEVTMPLPSDRVKRLRADFEEELAALAEGSLDAPQFERLMRLPAAEREAEIARIAVTDADRAARLREASAAADAAIAARARLNQAQQDLRAAREAGAEEGRIAELNAQIDRHVEETATAEIAYDAARDRALTATLDPGKLRRALAESDERRFLFDEATKKQIVRESPREKALNEILRAHPDRKADIEDVIAAYERFAAERTHLDDPADLKRMLASAGVLDFRIAVEPGHVQEQRLRNEISERGPDGGSANDMGWYRLDDVDGWYDSAQSLAALEADPRAYFASRYRLIVEPYGGNYYALLWDTRGNRLTHAEGDWRVASGYPTRDERGFPAIGFTMDPVGASLLGELTSRHVGQNMAVLLDDRVYTSPRLQSRISKSGQITGQFSQPEIDYITRVLGAGALQAKLVPEPLSESHIGPNLGLDNLKKGMWAGVIAFSVIAGFMILYYFSSGLIAVVALACNGLLLLGMMSLNKAAFTMPGIAGVILTFGMAVDANVLIFERMREELKKGNDLRTSVRLGYSKALSSIVDGNVTNLIVCVVLYSVGTQEIKGFAVTMSIGVLTTLFSALVISRVIYQLLVDHGPWRKASMLPLAIPAIDRFFERNINWLGMRHGFWVISAIFVGIGMFFAIFQGKEMLDNEFRGGTQITLQLTQTKSRQDVMDRVKQAADTLGQGELANQLRNANVLPVDPEADGVSSDQFNIKTLAQEQDTLMRALLPAFEDITEADPPLTFEGSAAQSARQAPMYRIIEGNLGADIGRPQYQDNVAGFRGGIAIVLENISPVQSLAEIRARLDRKRAEAEFSDSLSYQRDVRVLEGDEQQARSIVLLTRNPQLSYLDNEQRFEIEVEGREWRLVREALTEPSAPASVQNFSAAIATTFRAQAIVAIVLSFLLIGIYVWVRFGAVNYALGAVVPMLHDILIVVGAVALAEMLFELPATAGMAASIGLMPFKIDLAMIAAFLTIVGYSLNDSVVIMDRIRENRGKLSYATADAINNAVNQTLSRTVITSGTTLFSTLVLFFLGGEGVRGFAFSLSVGIIVGTYSSIALTAPMVWMKNPARNQKNYPPRPGSSGSAAAPQPEVAGTTS